MILYFDCEVVTGLDLLVGCIRGLLNNKIYCALFYTNGEYVDDLNVIIGKKSGGEYTLQCTLVSTVRVINCPDAMLKKGLSLFFALAFPLA